MSEKTPAPGACGDPECHVLHADSANPMHPPWYIGSDALAYPLTGEAMVLEPGRTYVLRALRRLSPVDIEVVKAQAEDLGVTFLVLDDSFEIVEALL